jgi:hypothetical protein
MLSRAKNSRLKVNYRSIAETALLNLQRKKISLGQD